MNGRLLNDRYRLDAELGQGGMGVVYQGYDTLLDREVAIKILSEQSKARLGSAGRARLLNEAQSAARLNHPNIVSIFDAGEAGGLPYIVMELLQGESLHDLRPDSIPQILSIARQISAALHHAHSLGVIHRDLKPENIVVLNNGKIKLTDFGLARSATARLTMEGMIVGTVLYLAPEAATGQGVDARADLYALGVLLYEMIAGVLPFTDNDPLAVISQHLYSPVTPLHVHRPDVTPALEELVLSLLEKQPECRPSNALEVQKAIETMEAVEALEAQTDQAKTLAPVEAAGPTLMLERIVRGRLVGRERELAEVKAILRGAYSGESSVLLVSGEAGIGKTRLVRELIAHAAVSGSKYLAGSCYSEGGMPYTPFPQLIATSFGISGISLDLPEYVMEDLAAISPELRLSLPQVSEPVFDPQSDQQRVFESITAWAAALAKQAPIIIFIDDIHWGDSSTLFLLRHLARRLVNQRVLIVLTYREVELGEANPLQNLLHDLNRERLSTRVKLTRFSLDQTRAMLETMLTPTGPISSNLVEAIYRETEGNPFFIEEVTKALIEEGRLCYEDVCWVAQDEAEIQIPQSVRVTIQTRLARLPEQAQEVLRLAAFIGREFEFEVLRQASDLEEEALIDALESAERAQIINEIKVGKAQTTFSFVHNLIPNTLRDGVGTLRRQRLHRRVAEAIKAVFPDDEARLETLAFHYEQAGDAGQAVSYFSRAANRALQVFANQEAERYYRLALEMDTETFHRAELLSGLGESLFRQGFYKQAGEQWTSAIDLYRQDGRYDQTARLYARLVRSIWYTGDNAASLSTALEGLSIIKEMNPPPEEAETPGLAALLHETARAYRFNDKPEQAAPLCRQALDLAERLGLVEVQAESLATIGILPDLSFQEREASLRRAIELAESAGLLVTAVRGHVNLGAHLAYGLQLVEGLSHFHKAIELGRRIGNMAWIHGFLGNAAEMAVELGDFEYVRRALDEMEELRAAIPEPEAAKFFADMLKSRLMTCQGNFEQAQALAAGYLEVPRIPDDSNNLMLVHIRMGEALLAKGQPEAASVHFIEATRLGGPKGTQGKVLVQLLAAEALLKHKRIEQAQEYIDEAGQIVARYNLNLYEKEELVAMRGYLAAARQRWDEAFAAFEEATGIYERLEVKWRLAKTICLWAEALIERQDHQDTPLLMELLTKASRLYDEMQIPYYKNHVDELLAKAGSSPGISGKTQKETG
jgi:tetratricopeptide (TPR) repeat protein